MSPRGRKAKTLTERFWANLPDLCRKRWYAFKYGQVPLPEGCWVWKLQSYKIPQLTSGPNGKQRTISARQLAIEIYNLPYNKKTPTAPQCDNRHCLHPQHLKAGHLPKRKSLCSEQERIIQALQNLRPAYDSYRALVAEFTKLTGYSRQYLHQLITGYRSPATRKSAKNDNSQHNATL